MSRNKKQETKKYFLPQVRIIEVATLEQLEDVVNEGLGYGYKIQALDHHRTEFFQSHSAVLVRKKSAWMIPTQKGGAQ